MRTYRARAAVLQPVTSLTAEQHAEIVQRGIVRELNWSTSTGTFGALVERFRAEVKDHYYRHQRRRCCYCSVELQHHKLTFDAEHILHKGDYVEYIFNAANIAVACKLCNGNKSNKSVAANGRRFSELSRTSEDYSIVHPHLDEWDHHLQFDEIGRIVANGASTKGQETIRICGITALNATRLADEFALDDCNEAEDALRVFHEVDDVARKRQLLELLSELAERASHPGARSVMQALQAEVAHDPVPDPET